MESDNEFFSFLTQMKDLVTTNRPLRLRLDTPGGVNDDMLLPQRVHGSEALCGGFEYRVLCVSARVSLPLKEMIALPATLEFVTDRGDLRSVSGIVTEAASGDSDGGLASYQLVLRDAFAIMDKRINTRVFRNLNELEIVQRMLSEWQQRSPTLGTCFQYEVDEILARADYPQREFTMQFNESDAHFMRRLLKRRGIGWTFRPDTSSGFPVHTLVLFNDANGLRANAAGTIRYHRDNATEQRDTITSWSAVRSLQPGSVGRHSWDYMNSLGTQFMSSEAQGLADQGVSGNELAASLDDYRILAPHTGDDSEDLCRLGQLRMARYDLESKCFHGEGSVRDLCSGEYFTLSEHAEVDEHPEEEREFLVTALQVTAHNNLPKALAARVERLFARNRWMRQGLSEQDVSEQVAAGALRMHVQFTAVRRGIAIVPDYDERLELPQVPMQSAIVVGPASEEVYCDQLGRVKIRFPGTRPEDHEHATGQGASDTETDSAWVRVASNWAGNGPGSMGQCGTVGLPRIGTEVLVAFLGGDPDKPVIVGQLYNQQAQPPALSNLDALPGNKHLSGIKSREVNGGRANQLRFDDTNGQISAQLASDHGDTQLNLGFLTQPKRHGWAKPRGEGAELRSDKAVAIRGAAGVLISAEAASPNGPQLDRNELIDLANRLRKIAEQLSKMASSHANDAPDGEQVNGLVSKISKLDSEAAQVAAIFGPEGVFLGSGQGLLIDGAKGVNVICGTDTRIDSAGSTAIRTAKGLSLFSNEGGTKITTVAGRVQMQAQEDGMELLAKRVLDIISTSDWINISAQQGIRIKGGGSELIIDRQGIKGHTSGNHEMHAATHQTFGPQGGAADLNREFPELSKLLTEKSWIEIELVDGETPLAGQRFVLFDAEGGKHEGALNERGVARIDSIAPGHCKVEFPDIGESAEVTV